MNYAGFQHGEAREVADALEGDERPDTTALTLALSNALRRIHALERRVGPLRDALSELMTYVPRVKRIGGVELGYEAAEGAAVSKCLDRCDAALRA